MPEAIQSLDLLAATAALELQASSDLENVSRKALGILQEQGTYAVILYLQSKERDACGKTLAERLLGLAKRVSIEPTAQTNTAVEQLQFLTKNVLPSVTQTLLVRQLWEQTLVYCIYHAKL